MANRFFRNTGNTSWSVTTNWSLTSGGASVGAIPTTSDDVFFDANSGACVTNVAGVGLSLTTTGYTNTLTFTNTITITGNVTLNSGITIAGAAALIISGTSTLTSNGKTIPNLTAQTAANITPSGALTITSLILGVSTFSGATGWTATTVTIGSGGTVTLAASTTYNVTTLNSVLATGSTHATVVSGTPGTKAVLAITGNVNVGYTNFTDINASVRPVYTFSGTVTTCTNVFSLTDMIAVPIEESLIN